MKDASWLDYVLVCGVPLVVIAWLAAWTWWVAGKRGKK